MKLLVTSVSVLSICLGFSIGTISAVAQDRVPTLESNRNATADAEPFSSEPRGEDSPDAPPAPAPAPLPPAANPLVEPAKLAVNFGTGGLVILPIPYNVAFKVYVYEKKIAYEWDWKQCRNLGDWEKSRDSAAFICNGCLQHLLPIKEYQQYSCLCYGGLPENGDCFSARR